MPDSPDLDPGHAAPQTGAYRLHNAFGSATDHVVTATEGEPLPDAPRWHTWRLLIDH